MTSVELAGRLGFLPAQVRRDLAHFGEFGVRGTGYPVPALLAALEKIVGVRKARRVVVVGDGELADALATSPQLLGPSFRVVGRLSALGEPHPDRPLEGPPEVAVVVGEAAPELAERLVALGIRAVLTIGPGGFPALAEGKLVARSVDLGAELERLAYAAESTARREGDGLSRRASTPPSR